VNWITTGIGPMGNNCALSLNSSYSSKNSPTNGINAGDKSKNKRRGPDTGSIIRMLLIGDSNVGKSSLLLRWTENSYSDTFMATIGVDFKIRNIELGDDTWKVQIWDTAGQERFRTITTSYYRGAHGVLLVYSITNRESFHNILKWLQEVEKYGQENTLKVLVGNKSDEEDTRVVATQEGRDLASKYNMYFFETSAKSGHNVDETFGALAASVVKKMQM